MIVDFDKSIEDVLKKEIAGVKSAQIDIKIGQVKQTHQELLNELTFFVGISEIEKETILDRIYFVPGYYYIVYFVFKSLIYLYEDFCERFNINIAITKSIEFIVNNYGCPPNLCLKKIDQEFKDKFKSN